MPNVSFHITNYSDIESLASGSSVESGGLYLNTANHRLYYATDDDNVVEIGTNPRNYFVVGEFDRIVSIQGADVSHAIHMYDTVGGTLNIDATAGITLTGRDGSFNTSAPNLRIASETIEDYFVQNTAAGTDIPLTITVNGIVVSIGTPYVKRQGSSSVTWNFSNVTVKSLGVNNGSICTVLQYTATPANTAAANSVYIGLPIRRIFSE